MMKATLRSAVLLGLLVSGTPAFAEVQNVKISGDITARAFMRKNLDLHDEHQKTGAGADASGAGSTPLEGENFFMTTTGINIGADLTENVSAFVRLANERDWNVTATPAATSDVAISQSYITLKELFYSPLTVRIGRQPITWGRGFVLGNYLIPGTVYRANDLHSSITANEFTDFTAFDAIRATLDLSNVGGMSLPLMLDTVYIKLNENSPSIGDDVNLMGFNLGTKFNSMSSEAELYYLNKRDKSGGGAGSNTNKDGSVSTLGIRGSTKPMESAYAWGELAYQFGQNAVDPSASTLVGEGHQAWAFDLGLEYTLANVPTTPKLGWEWEFWSGKNSDNGVAGWDPIARGYYTTALREFQTGGTTLGFYPTDQVGDTGASTNQSQMGWYVTLKPIEDLSITPRLTFFWQDIGAVPVSTDTGTRTGGDRRHFAGTEWDTNMVYNYTDDVQFGVLYALFSPGSIYRTPNDSTAQELITTVGVKF